MVAKSTESPNSKKHKEEEDRKRKKNVKTKTSSLIAVRSKQVYTQRR